MCSCSTTPPTGDKERTNGQMEGGEVLDWSCLGQVGDEEVVKEDGKGHFGEKEGSQG